MARIRRRARGRAECRNRIGTQPAVDAGVEAAAAHVEAVGYLPGGVLANLQEAEVGALRHHRKPVAVRHIDGHGRRWPVGLARPEGRHLDPGLAPRPVEPEGARAYGARRACSRAAVETYQRTDIALGAREAVDALARAIGKGQGIVRTVGGSTLGERRRLRNDEPAALDAALVRPATNAEVAVLAPPCTPRILDDPVVQARVRIGPPSNHGHGVRARKDGTRRDGVHPRGVAEKVAVHVEREGPWASAKHLDLHPPYASRRRPAHHPQRAGEGGEGAARLANGTAAGCGRGCVGVAPALHGRRGHKGIENSQLISTATSAVAVDDLLGRDDDIAERGAVAHAQATAVRGYHAESVARVAVTLIERVERIALQLTRQRVSCVVGIWEDVAVDVEASASSECRATPRTTCNFGRI